MIVYGGSGHVKEIVDILLLNGINVDKIVDADPQTGDIFGIPVEKVSAETEFIAGTLAVVAIGSNLIGKEIALSHPFTYAKAIQPRSCVSKYAEIGKGTIVMANASVIPDVAVSKHCIINTGAMVNHGCILDDYTHPTKRGAFRERNRR